VRRSRSITREQVYEAANAIWAEGKDVTAKALLTKLGRGSLTTIYKHLVSWSPVGHDETSESRIPEPVQAAFASAWKTAALEAKKETISAQALQEIQERLNKVTSMVETEKQKSSTQIEWLMKNAVAEVESQRKLQVAVQDTESLAENIRLLGDELEKLRMQVELEARRDTEQRNEIERLRQELQKTRQELSAEFLKAIQAQREENSRIVADFQRRLDELAPENNEIKSETLNKSIGSIVHEQPRRRISITVKIKNPMTTAFTAAKAALEKIEELALNKLGTRVSIKESMVSVTAVYDLRIDESEQDELLAACKREADKQKCMAEIEWL
jgi:hypothetical protein